MESPGLRIESDRIERMGLGIESLGERERERERARENEREGKREIYIYI